MITRDLDQLLAPEISDLARVISPGTTSATGVTSAGTWRAAPPDGARGPGTYATPVAFRLAEGDAAQAVRAAVCLAGALRRAGLVRSATATGGFVTVTVTSGALTALAVRITEAGSACARSTALAGATIPAPRDPDLASAADWTAARRQLSASISGRLAEAAGARVLPPPDTERLSPQPPAPAPSDEPAFRGVAAPAAPGAARGPVADAVAFAGSWAISYALARLPPGTAAPPDPGAAAAHHLGNPAYAVRYAHAHAASTLRQAADLGLRLGEAAESGHRLLTHPSEQWLLDELSWLPERVAGAARRARPDVLTRYLEGLAGAYFDCQEACPAMGPGAGTGGPQTVARLWLAAASGTALRAGLGLLGVDAPERL